MSDFLGGKLDNREIYIKLSEYKFPSSFKPTEDLIDSILDQFWFHDLYNSFISDEVYLQYLLKYLDQVKPQKFNRYDFYRYLFDEIEKESKDRSILQQIALAFEKQLSDAMSPDEYTLLLQNVSAPTGKFNSLWMENHHLGKIREKDKKELFIWEHHTLTEFLVAEHLLDSRKFLDEFQKLAVLKQEGITAFKPSWSGVLRFLMESNKGSVVILWLISFLETYPDNLDDNLAEILAYILRDQTLEIKNRIFKLVYDMYFQRVVWLPVWARVRLSKFINDQSYKRLKSDIKEWPSKTETFVRRGNVVSIIEGLLEDKNKLLNKAEKKFWRERIIEFANNPNDDGNGVLQRHSLDALALFKDDKTIPLVAQKCFEETRDSLVRDEFIQFCYNSTPNSMIAIDYFIKGIKRGSDIYARHGLYKITTKTSISYFLLRISQDEQFLRAFLEHESIFDKEEADRELVKTIENLADKEIIGSLKKIIFTVLRIDAFYKEDQSKFLKRLVQIISKHDSKYIFELLNDIKKEKDEQVIDRLFYDSKELIAFLLTKDNVQQYFQLLQKFPERAKRDAQYSIYIARRTNDKVGELVYQEAIKLKLVEKVDVGYSQKYAIDQQKKRKTEIYKSFVKQLEPEQGKYMPSVFKYYLDNRKDIEEQWEEKDKKRLLKLIVDEGVRKIDPRKFNVKIENRHEGNNKFTWSAQAAYYGDIIEVLKEIAPDEIIKHKQNIIDFVPYEFGTSATLKYVEKLQNKELKWVNKVMSDKKDDRRYLIPQTYIYLVGEYAKRGCNLPSVKNVLKSFINDPEIQDYNKNFALENLVHFIDKSDIDTKKFLKNIFDKTENLELSKIANGLLITIYRDERSIDWRFKKLKEPFPFEGRKMDGLAHEVGPIENELDTMALAKPLIDLRDERYLQRFLELLDYSFQFLKDNEDKKYRDYSAYLWRIVITFVENLKGKGSFIPLMDLESWVSEHSQYEQINWFMARIIEIKRNYLNNVNPFDKLITGVEELNKLRIPAASISYFLLKSQEVETKLRDLILGINYFLEKANSKLPIYRKLNSKNKLRIKNSTLSQLCDELSCYPSQSVENLKNKLDKFSSERNRFNHELFNQNMAIHELGEEAKKYTKFAEQSLDLIHEVWKDILKVK